MPLFLVGAFAFLKNLPWQLWAIVGVIVTGAIVYKSAEAKIDAFIKTQVHAQEAADQLVVERAHTKFLEDQAKDAEQSMLFLGAQNRILDANAKILIANTHRLAGQMDNLKAQPPVVKYVPKYIPVPTKATACKDSDPPAPGIQEIIPQLPLMNQGTTP